MGGAFGLAGSLFGVEFLGAGLVGRYFGDLVGSSDNGFGSLALFLGVPVMMKIF
jgi:hypothetical protein